MRLNININTRQSYVDNEMLFMFSREGNVIHVADTSKAITASHIHKRFKVEIFLCMFYGLSYCISPVNNCCSTR